MSYIIKVDRQIHLDAIKPTDKHRYVELFKEKEIYDHTLAIPFPYSEADADWWINENQKS